MPFFRFLIHGHGEIAEGIAGFYTTKWCYAATREQAAAKALGYVRSEWDTGEYAKLKRGPLSLEIEEATRISPLAIWKAANKGHTFYRADDESDVAAVALSTKGLIVSNRLPAPHGKMAP
jgi:hypothetical protein